MTHIPGPNASKAEIFDDIQATAQYLANRYPAALKKYWYWAKLAARTDPTTPRGKHIEQRWALVEDVTLRQLEDARMRLWDSVIQHMPDVADRIRTLRRGGGWTPSCSIDWDAAVAEWWMIHDEARRRMTARDASPRSAPMSKAELARRITNNNKARPRVVDWERFDMQSVSDRRVTVSLENMDKAMRERVLKPIE